MVETARDNASWIAHLKSGGQEQQTALSELRQILLNGLHRAVSTRNRVDESFLEDAVQDALLVILEKLDTFQGRSRFTTWATSIAIRVAMSRLRRKQWQDVSLDQLLANNQVNMDDNDNGNPEPGLDSDRSAIVNKMYSIIQNDLTSKQRTALLSELKEVPQEEIARHLGTNRNAIYKLTHDARKHLKRCLESAGYHADDIRTMFTT